MKRTIIGVELQPELFSMLQEEADIEHVSKSDIVRSALYGYIEHQKEIRDFFTRYPHYNAYTQRMED